MQLCSLPPDDCEVYDARDVMIDGSGGGGDGPRQHRRRCGLRSGADMKNNFLSIFTCIALLQQCKEDAPTVV